MSNITLPNTSNVQDDSTQLSDNKCNLDNLDIGIIRAREKGYDNAIYVIRYLLDDFNSTKFEDEKTNIALKIFKFLNANPTILQYEPQLYDSVIQKINDIDNKIYNKQLMFKNAKYSKAIKMMKVSMLINIHNHNMRKDIYNHLDQISTILKDYSIWSKRTELRSEMNTLRNRFQIDNNYNTIHEKNTNI
jgi:hypothetical protein